MYIDTNLRIIFFCQIPFTGGNTFGQWNDTTLLQRNFESLIWIVNESGENCRVSANFNHSCYMVLGYNWPRHPSHIPGILRGGVVINANLLGLRLSPTSGTYPLLDIQDPNKPPNPFISTLPWSFNGQQVSPGPHSVSPPGQASVQEIFEISG